MTASSGQVMASLARGVVEAAAELSVDLEDVLARFEVRPADLDRTDVYVPVDLHEALWAAAAARAGRSDFGICAAGRFNPGLTGVVEYIMRNCGTFREAGEAWGRLAELVCDRITSEVVVGATGEVVIGWRLDRPDSLGARQWTEFALGRAVGLVREGTGLPRAAPREVWFRHAPPEDVRAHEALFLAPVRFGRPKNALLWDPGWLEQPLRGVDPAVRRALETRADALERARGGAMEARCRAAILALLESNGGDAQLGRVAEQLELSPRTVQRRLKARGLNFQVVLDAVRAEEAERLLEAHSLAEVARRLGYADAASLRKARRRWLSR